MSSAENLFGALMVKTCYSPSIMQSKHESFSMFWEDFLFNWGEFSESIGLYEVLINIVYILQMFLSKNKN